MNMPEYATFDSAAADLRSSAKKVTLKPGARALISTGVFGSDVFADEPSNVCGLVCPRSGLAYKHGVTVLNAPGVIDHDYSDVIKVLLVNLGDEDYTVSRGDRIAQLMLIKRSVSLEFEVRESERVGGFGSTGK